MSWRRDSTPRKKSVSMCWCEYCLLAPFSPPAHTRTTLLKMTGDNLQGCMSINSVSDLNCNAFCMYVCEFICTEGRIFASAITVKPVPTRVGCRSCRNASTFFRQYQPFKRLDEYYTVQDVRNELQQTQAASSFIGLMVGEVDQKGTSMESDNHQSRR